MGSSSHTARPPAGSRRRPRPGAGAMPAPSEGSAAAPAEPLGRRRHIPAATGTAAAAAVALLALLGSCCCGTAAAFLQSSPPPPPVLSAAAATPGRAAEAPSPSPCRIRALPSPSSSLQHGGGAHQHRYPSSRLFSALADRQPTASSGSDNEGKGGSGSKQAPAPAPLPAQAASAAASAASAGVDVLSAPLPRNADEEEASEAVAEYVAECEMPTDRGTFRMRSYRCRGRFAALEPVALTHGPLRGREGVLARIHDQCLTSEVFGSKRCDCKEQLGMALDRIREEGGVVIYLQQEGRGIGLANKVAAYALQDEGLDTVDANRHLGFGDDERTYDIVPSILQDLGVQSIRLLTNNPLKLQCLQGLGVQVTRVEPIVVAPNAHNARYLLTKQERMDHALLDLDATKAAAAAPLLSRRKGKQQLSLSSGKEAVTAAGDSGKWDYSPQRVQEALGALKAGRPIVLVDGHSPGTTAEDSTSSSHGDLVMPAGQATPQALSTYIRATSGIVYALLSPQRLAELWKGSGAAATAAGIDARVGGGSSAAGRAATLRSLGGSGPLSLKDFRSPGHVFAIAPGAAIGTAPGEGAEGLLTPSRVDLRRAWALELVRAAAPSVAGGGEKEETAAAAVAEMIDHDTGENLDVRGVEAWAARQGLCVTSVADVARFLEGREGER